MPLVRSERSLSVAFGDPTDREALAEMERVAGLPIVPSVATPSSIATALDRFAGDRSRGLRRAGVQALVHAAPRASVSREGSGSALLAGHVRRALLEGALEIHILPEGDEILVFHRVGPRLVYAGRGPSSLTYLLLARLEALGGPAYDGEQTHARGRAICPLAEQDVLLDISLLTSEAGLAITLGLRESSAAVPELDSLGIDPLDLACVRGVLDQPSGLVLRTPRGCASAAPRAKSLGELLSKKRSRQPSPL